METPASTSIATDPQPTSSTATADPPPSTEPQTSSSNPSPNLNPNPPHTLEPPQPQSQPPPQQRPTQLPRPATPQPIPRVAIGVPANFQTNRPQNPSISGNTPFSNAPPFRPSNPPSYVQPFAAMHRPSSVGGPDLAAAQARQPVPGVQTIGMIGSLSTAPTASQMRPSGALGQNQPRLGQPQMRSITPSTNQSLNSQRFSGHVGLRGPSISSPSSQSSIPHNAQSLQHQWMSAQGKQSNASSLPSSSYRPQIRPQTMQQRPQHSLPMTSHHLQVPASQQQQQKQHALQHPQQEQQQNPQSISPQHQAARAIVPATPKSNVQAVAQAALATSNPCSSADEFSNDIISRKRIRELVTQVDRSEDLRPEIEDDLLEIADDFIESVVTASCHLAKHRKSTTLEAKDILLHVERHWNMTLPGFSGDEIKCYKKPVTNDIHKERLAMIKKSMVGTNDGVNTKTSAAGGQTATNPKLQATKTLGIGD